MPPTIINLARIQKGGGLQNALSFLEMLAKQSDPKEFLVVARRATPLAIQAISLKFPTLEVKNTPFSLLKFELGCRKYFSQGQLCFTFFGPPWLATAGYLLNVAGVAYSNLYYPEIPFWDFLKTRFRFRKELTDHLRLWWIGLADYWIFETDILARRAVELARYPKDRVTAVRMAASSLVGEERVAPKMVDKFNQSLGEGFRFLFLAGAHPNKSIHQMAPIAAQLRSRTSKPFCIVTTMEESTAYYRQVHNAFSEHNMLSCWSNIGPVSPEDVASLIHCCDSMCLFSRLESFSNNFVESWRMRKLLVVRDADWSRDACGAGALYVNPGDPETASQKFARAIDDASWLDAQIQNGTAALATYPTAEEKCTRYLKALSHAKKLGIMPGRTRRQLVRWKCAQKGTV